MTRIAIAIFFGLVALSAAIACAGRYEVTQALGPRFYLTDRWTGDVSLCLWIGPYSSCHAVYPARPPLNLPMTEPDAEKFLDSPSGSAAKP
jgi:hypothetical protein